MEIETHHDRNSLVAIVKTWIEVNQNSVPTHGLVITLSFESSVSKDQITNIHKFLRSSFEGKKIVGRIEQDEDPISLEWKSVDETFLYLCKTRLADSYVRSLTRSYLDGLLKNILQEFQLEEKDLSLQFIIQKISSIQSIGLAFTGTKNSV